MSAIVRPATGAGCILCDRGGPHFANNTASLRDFLMVDGTEHGTDARFPFASASCGRVRADLLSRVIGCGNGRVKSPFPA